MFDIAQINRLNAALEPGNEGAIPAWLVRSRRLSDLEGADITGTGAAGDAALAWAQCTGFEGAAGTVCLIPNSDDQGAVAAVLIGIGETTPGAPFAAFTVAQAAPRLPKGLTIRLCNSALLTSDGQAGDRHSQNSDGTAARPASAPMARAVVLGWALEQYTFPAHEPKSQAAAPGDEEQGNGAPKKGTPEQRAAEKTTIKPGASGQLASDHVPSGTSQDQGAPGAQLRKLTAHGAGDSALSIANELAAVTLGRDLINTPANLLGPDELEAAARAVSALHGAQCTVITGDALIAENYPLIHAVGAASTRAPRLIRLSWNGCAPSGRGSADEPGAGDISGPADQPPRVAIIGKGVCFDTGGLNLKPGGAMGLMKKDMGGAAAALTLAHMIMGAGLNLQLDLYIPAVENAVSGNAFRPGDVFPARNGTTVEISNTDAEGRLVLADAMVRACEDAPAHLITLATLTGAARVALGPDLVPLYATNQSWARDIMDAGMHHADPLWQMPFWAPYDTWLQGDTGQVNHAPETPFAGSITAALFLARFAKGAANYTHLDLYGWTPKPCPGRPKGGQPQGARALFWALAKRYGTNNDAQDGTA